MIRWKSCRCLQISVALLALLVLTLAACRHTPDETQVRDAIASVAQAAQAGAASGVSAPLSHDFDGNAGALDRRALHNMVRLMALRGERIRATLGPVAVEHRGARMVASFTVTLRSGSGLLRGQAGVYQVESAWRNDDGKWRCYTATWQHAL